MKINLDVIPAQPLFGFITIGDMSISTRDLFVFSLSPGERDRYMWAQLTKFFTIRQIQLRRKFVLK